MWAIEHYGIEPDLITLSKALGGGLPIGAMLAKEHVAAAFSPGDHASTFGGSAITAAAACAAVRTIIEEDLPGNAARLGSYLGERLGQLGPPVKEVRATGLLIGMDLETPQAAAVKTQCREHGLLINTVGDSMLRLMPPLIITREQADQGLAILAQALKAV
jgi:acetylornithine/succinyldiaminopimelate/putrescine aminotransferase